MTESVTVTRKPRKRQKPNYYVYFNEWTGEIVSVGHSLNENTNIPYIITRDESARKIIDGTADEANFRVELDKDHNYRMMEISNVLRLRSRENQLYEISRKRDADWDVRAIYYVVNKKLIFEINPVSLKRLANLQMRQKLRVDYSDNLKFYLIKKNNPDFLIETYEVNPEDLIMNRRVVIDAGDITAFASPNEISMLTLRYFENYRFEIIQDRYISQDQRTVKKETNQIKTAENISQDDNHYHIEFLQKDDQLIISSCVIPEQFEHLGLVSKQFPFYLVGDTVDEFIGAVKVDLSRLRLGYVERHRIDFDIEKVNILYKNHNLVVGKRKVK